MADIKTGTSGKAKKAGILSRDLGENGRIPSKRSINLLYVEKHTGRNIAELMVFACFMVCLVLFSKFMVVDKLAEIDRLQSNYKQMERSVEAAKGSVADSDRIRAEYSHYGNGYLNDDEKALQDRMAILKVIEDKILRKDALKNVSLSGNTATLTINSSKLSSVSALVKEIESEEIVSYVQVQGAASQADAVRANDQVITTMTITFRTPDEVTAARAQQAEEAKYADTGADSGADVKVDGSGTAGNEDDAASDAASAGSAE